MACSKAPDLITLVLPGSGATASLGADAPGDALYSYCFSSRRLRLRRSLAAMNTGDQSGAPPSRWCALAGGSESGTPEHPVVLLEVQMQSKAGVKHRLWAQTARFAQLHPQVQVLEVDVAVPHRRLRLGPDRLPRQLEAFLAGVHWLGLEELGQQPGLDPLLSLLTLPVLPNPEIPNATEQLLQPRPDLLETVLSILGERFPHLTRKEIMAWPIGWLSTSAKG